MPDQLTARTRASVTVTGVVQGVGFRPFVYRTAVDCTLGGWVKNTGDAGVEIEVEGQPADVEAFLRRLRDAAPPLARLDAVEVGKRRPRGETTFDIVASGDEAGGAGSIPPDTGICPACLADIRDPESRYYQYWASSCVDCGPRYSVIRGLPYDRPTTSMDEFPMCAACRAEYEDPADRRYHAQTIACPNCGPRLSLSDASGTPEATGIDAIQATALRLEGGNVVAVKGIGGYHLACVATDGDAVSTLRSRTDRPAKPFAIMAPSLDRVRKFASVSRREASALESTRRPIVLLETRGHDAWLEGVAPGLHTVGVMLPYTGLHHLLFDYLDDPLVLTSANRPGRPMCLSREDVLERVGDVVDAVLDHDREIVARCDDSVVRFTGNDRRFVRRSRGWVPERIALPGCEDGEHPSLLALGPAFDTTVAVTLEGDVIPSHHIGDVEGPETLAAHRAAVEHLLELFDVTPELVACDLHPDFLTAREADRYAAEGVGGAPAPEVVRVQHHHAHAAALLGEHDVERAIVITADGTGYGPDGTIWGGEVLDATRSSFERVGGLDTFRLPGGEAAIRRPARILADLLAGSAGLEERLVSRGAVTDGDSARTVIQQATLGVNAPETTSAGRFLDAISALCGICTERRYQGEPAMRLEAAAAGADSLDVEPPFTSREGTTVIDVAALTSRLATLVESHPADEVAATAQQALADGLAEIAIEAAESRDLDSVGFTGGVAYNEAIFCRIRERVTDAGLGYLAHEAVPPGDGGIAYGQAVVAAANRS